MPAEPDNPIFLAKRLRWGLCKGVCKLPSRAGNVANTFVNPPAAPENVANAFVNPPAPLGTLQMRL